MIESKSKARAARSLFITHCALSIAFLAQSLLGYCKIMENRPDVLGQAALLAPAQLETAGRLFCGASE